MLIYQQQNINDIKKLITFCLELDPFFQFVFLVFKMFKFQISNKSKTNNSQIQICINKSCLNKLILFFLHENKK